MILLALSALLNLSQPATVVAAASCSGADPAIVSAVSRLTNTTNDVNHYAISVTVRNLGRVKQSNDVLQYVAMYQNEKKTDTHGIPPLRPGQSYTVTFTIQRATGTEDNSTRLRFELGFRRPSPPGTMDCNAQNDTFTLEV